MLAAVVRIVAGVTRRAQPGAGMDTKLSDLDGLDSLRLLETVALAEEQFGVLVATGELDQLESLGDIVRLVAAGQRG